MEVKNQLKSLLSDSPIAKARRRKMREALTNREFSFFTPNCMGGILMHDLGLRFLTPTVNLMMKQPDFLLFVLHLDEYLQGKLLFFHHVEYTCPCAHLCAEGLPSIDIHFTHYHSAEEAEQKWHERLTRIQRDNLFVFLEERDGITRADLEKLANLSARGVLAFTCNPYPDLPYCVYLPKS